MRITKSEQTLLSAILFAETDEEIGARIEVLKSSVSKLSPKGQQLYNFLVRKFKNNEKMLITKEEGKREDIDYYYATEVMDKGEGYAINSTEDMQRYITELEKEQARFIGSELSNLSDFEEIKDRIEKLNGVFSNTRKIDKINLRDVSKKFFNNIDELQTMKSIKTKNWNYFNKTLKFYPGDVTVIAGRPGAGKTAFALSLALELARNGNKGIYFSLEMGEEQIINRLMSQISIVEMKHFQDPEEWQKLGKNEMARITSASEKMCKLSEGLQIVSGNFSSSDIYDISKDEKVDYIIIDYMQLLQGGQGRGRVEEITYLSMELKRIAMKLQIPVIELCQLSRAVEQRTDKHPMLSDLRESGQIEQDASTVIGLYRESYYNLDCQDVNKLEVGILKNRNGRTCSLMFDFIGNIQRVSEREIQY